jgi:hypothetical protein
MPDLSCCTTENKFIYKTLELKSRLQHTGTQSAAAYCLTICGIAQQYFSATVG